MSAENLLTLKNLTTGVGEAGIEILQLLMLEPKLAIFDETDSGLDVDAVKTVFLRLSDMRV